MHGRKSQHPHHAPLESSPSIAGQAGGKPMQAFLDEAIDHYQREKILDEVNAAYATLRNNPKAWKAELAERALWDKTLADGTKDE